MRIGGVLAVALALAPLPLAGQDTSGGLTVVIVHGAWGGGWDWKDVERALRARGHDVYRPTLTGLGERHHLASADIGLDTHATDVTNLIVWEDLHDILLMGHSYGGMVITAVAERVPTRIKRLVYLDAMIPFDGECALSVWGGDLACGDVEAVPDQSDGFVIPGWLEPGTPPPHDVPHPAKTLADPIELVNQPGGGLPATYILTRDAPGEADDFDWAAERAAALGWPVIELVADHNPQRAKVDALVDLLLGAE